MGWDAAIFGTVKLGKSARTKWLERSADSNNVKNAAVISKARFGPQVGEALGEIEHADLVHLEIEMKKDFRIAAILEKDQYIDWGPAIAAIAGAAFDEGGKGEIIFCGLEGIAFTHRMTRAPLETLSPAHAGELPEMKRLVKVRGGEAPKAAQGAWALNPFTKQPVFMPRTKQNAKMRKQLIAHGFDPDTGEPVKQP